MNLGLLESRINSRKDKHIYKKLINIRMLNRNYTLSISTVKLNLHFAFDLRHNFTIEQVNNSVSKSSIVIGVGYHYNRSSASV